VQAIAMRLVLGAVATWSAAPEVQAQPPPGSPARDHDERRRGGHPVDPARLAVANAACFGTIIGAQVALFVESNVVSFPKPQ
jgi:hypothetical protein